MRMLGAESMWHSEDTPDRVFRSITLTWVMFGEVCVCVMFCMRCRGGGRMGPTAELSKRVLSFANLEVCVVD